LDLSTAPEHFGMDIELAALHQAGHAVMQWLVGWEVIELQMTVR
jgi:hypothetical protein